MYTPPTTNHHQPHLSALKQPRMAIKKTSSLNNLITWVLFLCSSYVFIFSDLLLGTVDPEIWLMNEQHDYQLYKSVYPSIQRERAEIMGSEVFVVVMLI